MPYGKHWSKSDSKPRRSGGGGGNKGCGKKTLSLLLWMTISFGAIGKAIVESL